MSDGVNQAETKPIARIRPVAGWRPLDLKQLWTYRELWYFLVWRDIQVRYKQTVLGIAWAVLQPLMTMAVFSLFLGRLGQMENLLETTSFYPLFVFAGLLPWTLFTNIVGQASTSFLASGNLITKVFFPRLLVPLASVGTALVDFALSCGVMALLLLCYRIVPPPSIILFPLFFVGILLAAIGIGTFVSALVVPYRDFRYVIGFLLQLGMFASPIAYPLRVIPEGWQLVYSLNPMAGLISGFRSCLLGDPFRWDCIAVSFVCAVVCFVGGVAYFRQVERRFADII